MSMSISSTGGAPQRMAMSGASARMPPQQKMSNLYNKIDSSGTGSINQAQFDQAFSTMNPPAAIKAQGASAIWSQLDPSGTGSVSKNDFVSTMKSVVASAFKGEISQDGGTMGTSSLTSAGQSLNALGSGNDGIGSQVNILV